MDLTLFNVHTTSTDWAYFTLLEELDLSGLDLQTPQQLPSNLRVLKLMNIQGKQAELDGLPHLEKLTIVCGKLTRLSITSSLRKPREATVKSCDKLVEVQFIGVLQSMKILDIKGCRSLERLVCVSEEELGCNKLQPRELIDGLRRASIVSRSLKMLQNLSLEGCPELQEIQFVSRMESLEILVVKGCDSLRRLGGLSNLKNLKEFLIQDAHSLQIVEGIDELERVERLTIHGCKSMGRIIDVSTSKIPKECWMELSFCGELPETAPYGLDLHDSSMTWDREKILKASASGLWHPPLEQDATKLKVLNIQYDDRLSRISTFSENSVLEKLSIYRCRRLVGIVSSIGKLKCLAELIVEDCEMLSELPDQIGELKNLQRLTIRECSKLRKLPDSISKLESLTTLDVRKTGITRLPGTMSKLSQLHKLVLDFCDEIQELPELPRSLTSLRFKSRSLKIMPYLSNLTNLVELSLSDGSYGSVGSNLIQPCHFFWTGGLSKLTKMDLNHFNVLATSVDWAYFTLLEELTLSGLDLQTWQQLPSNLRVLRLKDIRGKQAELDGLPQLEKLNINGGELTRLSITSSVRKLREAEVCDCDELVEVEFIGILQSMKILDIRDCKSLERLVCVPKEPGCTDGLRGASIVSGSLKMLQYLSLEICPKLQEIQFVSIMESLENLLVSGCNSLRRLGGLSNLKNLKNLLIQYSHSLQIVKGIDELEHVERLMIHGCKSMGMIIAVSTSKIPDKCRMDLSFCGELPRAYGSISWECYRENVLNAQTQASDFDIRTNPYMWERYREDILKDLTQALAFDIEANFSDSKVETGDPLLEQQFISFKINNELVRVEAESFGSDDEFDIDSVKAELACLYYLHLSEEKRSKGLLPIIQQILNEGKPLPCLEAVRSLRYLLAKGVVEVLIHDWIQKPLMKLYVDCCKDLTEQPNMKLLKRLYHLEVSEDEVILSECELQDVSATPLLNALRMHGTIAMLNLSHNLLGNGTMEKLQQVFQSSGQSYGDLSLDLHCNRFGPTALFQICECPVLLERLAVLNISGNRLTDACGSYIATILKKCRALYSLNVERCSIASRTIKKAAEALEAGSMLERLYIGTAIIHLLSKLASLESFSELSLSGLKLSKTVVDSLCQISKRLSWSGLMLGGTNIGTDGALQLSESLLIENQELVKLDLSFCGLTAKYFSRQLIETLVCGIVELNLGGNLIKQEGINALASVLMHPQCGIKVLILNKCQLGLSGVVEIIQALAENGSLKELNLADNANNEEILSSSQIEISPTHPLSSLDSSAAKEIDPAQPCTVNQECNQLKVADSEDGQTGIEPDASGVNQSCASSWERIGAAESPFAENLSMAIGMAKQLESLDLSNNGLSVNAVESIYAAWSTSRCSLAHRHIDKGTVHLSCQANKCCRLRPCCKRD